MTESQPSICTWADATFGVPVSDASIAARALVEMAELVTACVNGEPAERIGDEVADVVIVLARLGRNLEVDVVLDAKHAWAPAGSAYRYATGATDALSDLLMALEPDREHRRWATSCLSVTAIELWNLAAVYRVDLPSAIDAKMAVNRARRWERDGNGHWRHVEGALVACVHDQTERGKSIPLVWGSYESEVCKACGAFRARGSDKARSIRSAWLPASEYAEATAPPEDE